MPVKQIIKKLSNRRRIYDHTKNSLGDWRIQKSSELSKILIKTINFTKYNLLR